MGERERGRGIGERGSLSLFPFRVFRPLPLPFLCLPGRLQSEHCQLGIGEGDWGERIPLPFSLSCFSPSSPPLFVPARQATVRALPAGHRGGGLGREDPSPFFPFVFFSLFPSPFCAYQAGYSQSIASWAYLCFFCVDLFGGSFGTISQLAIFQ